MVYVDRHDPKRAMLKAVFTACLLWIHLGVASAAQLLSNAEVCVREAADCVFKPTKLPYFWDAVHPAKSGQAVFILKFPRPTGDSGPAALYIQRLGNGYELRLNGDVLEQSIQWKQPNGPDSAKAPILIKLPAGLLRADNELKISLRADVARRGGLSEVQLGDFEEIRPLYWSDYRLRVIGVEIGASLTGLVALLAWALWISRPERPTLSASSSPPQVNDATERDPAYLYAAVSMSGWCLFFCDTVIEVPIPPWPFWGLMVATGFSVGICAITLFCQDVAGLETSRSRRVMLAVGSAGALSAASTLWLGWWAAWAVWLGIIVIAYVVYGAYFAWRCYLAPSAARLLLAAAVLINVFGGAWDWVTVLRDGDLYGDNSYGHYLPMLYALTLGFILVQRFRQTSLLAKELSNSMARQVQAKSEELEESYRGLEQLAREQARSTERASILRDMHDGVGSHLASAIRQLQSGSSDRAQLLSTLNESLDQLKLTIDAMKLPRGDIAALLADLRYRLEPRLLASDLALHWHVAPIAPVLRFDSEALRQIQYVVYEAFSNVIQHAKARSLTLALDENNAKIVLSITDDGRGYDVPTVRARGLAAMRQRCEAIGADLLVASVPGATCVRILISR